ncbi:MAG: cytochrome P450 [Aquabacterium sp.]|nr:cytochrome P450 [Aquabacterium sp.]
MKTSIIADATATPLRHLKDLPGPRPWPIVGNALQVDLHRLHQNIETWVKQYGPLMTLKLGGMQFMVVSDHELISSLLRDRPDTFRRSSRMQRIMSEMGIKDGVFAAEGSTWSKQRRMVMASFSPGQVRSYLPALLNVTKRLQSRWQLAAKQGASVDLQADLMRFTVDAVSGLAFGVDVNTLSSNDDVIQQHLDQIFPTIWRRMQAIVPYWRVLKLPRDHALDRSVRAVNEAIRVFMADARVRLQDAQRRAAPPNLLEGMIVAAEASGSGITDDDVVGNVFTMLLAGEDTTATSLSWMIYLLSRHPEALQRARDEVDRLMGPVDTWTAESLGQLDYMEGCIHETMRLKPVGPFNAVEALVDTQVAGVRIPAKTGVLLVMRHDTLRDECFPQAQQFMPERWLPEADHLAPDHAKRVSMPFGAGPRICPGRYLALLEIKLAAAMLLQSFDIVSVDTPDGGEAQELMSLTMVPVGLRMTLRRR